jgi:hypothetical protein
MSDVKKCPEYGGEIEEGFLISPGALWWDTQKHEVLGEGEQIVPFSMSIQNLEAYRCKKCQLIVFKYTYRPPEPVYKWPSLHKNKDGPEFQK